MRVKSHIEFALVLLHPGDDKEVKNCFMQPYTPWWWISEGRNMQKLTIMPVLWFWRIVCIFVYIV